MIRFLLAFLLQILEVKVGILAFKWSNLEGLRPFEMGNGTFLL